MAILPTRTLELLEFMEQHATVWQGNAAGIGLSPAQATALVNAATEARAQHTNQMNVAAEARAATLTARTQLAAARVLFADAIRTIKAFAQHQADPKSVYALAQIPPPTPPGPRPPPGLPTDFRAVLEPNGAITLRWKCQNPPGVSGTVYNVRRRLAGEAQYQLLGAIGMRRFTDQTIPPGTPAVQYVVQGQRGPIAGPPSLPFIVQFGSSGDDGLTITAQFTGEPDAKLAA